MPIVMWEYLEVNLIGTVLILTMLICTLKRHLQGQNGEQRYFTAMLVQNALILLSDSGIYVLRGHGGTALLVLNHALCIVYFLMNIWFCYAWVRFLLLRLYPRWRPGGLLRAVLYAPAAAGSLAVCSSPATGWIYTITNANVYQRGPYMYHVFAAAVLYWVASSAVVLHECFHPCRSRETSVYVSVLIFPLPILLGNILQLRFYGLSIVWVCSAISMLVLFIDMLNDELLRDPLTGLFNRRQANAQLQWEIRHPHVSEGVLVVVMLDINHFKTINDRFGHLEGDRALTVAAHVLRQNCRRSDCISRFGGDEFLLVGRMKAAADADRMLGRIDAALELQTAALALPYELTFSAGWVACMPSDTVTLDLLLDEADGKMYENKRRRSECRSTE